MRVFTTETERRIDAKRRHLVDLILEGRKVKLQALQANPFLDMNELAVLKAPGRKQMLHDIANMDEAYLDSLIEHHAPSGHQYVW